MTFETEPLQFKPFRWLEGTVSPGISIAGEKNVFFDDFEMGRVVEAISRLQKRQEQPLTIQDLVLELRTLNPPARLHALKRAVEYLHARGLLENPAARSWVELMNGGIPRLSTVQKVIHIFRVRPRSEKPPGEQWEDLPFLRALEPSLRRRMLQGARVRQFPAGFRLCRQGGKDRDLMIILSGRAAVVKRTPGQPGRVVAELQQNSVFGEVSYFLRQRRSADVIAQTDCQVLCLPAREDFKTLEKEAFETLQTRLWFLQALQRNHLLKDIPAEAFDALLLNGSRVHFDPGHQIVQEGDRSDACYFVIQGEVRILQGEREINRVKAGSVIGEIGMLFSAGGRTATAVAETPVLAISYNLDQFWSVLSKHVTLGLALEELAERRLARDRARLA